MHNEKRLLETQICSFSNLLDQLEPDETLTLSVEDSLYYAVKKPIVKESKEESKEEVKETFELVPKKDSFTLEEYEELLKNLDWYYTYSEDPRVYNRGKRKYNQAMIVSELSDDHKKLFDKYSPFR